MKKFLVRIAWSQTDHENVLVDAEEAIDAEIKVQKAFPGIHHILGVSEIHHWIID